MKHGVQCVKPYLLTHSTKVYTIEELADQTEETLFKKMTRNQHSSHP